MKRGRYGVKTRSRARYKYGAARGRAKVFVRKGFTRQAGYYGRYSGTRAELKFHDIDVDEAAADWSGGKIQNAGSICLIGQGITESTRIGRKCILKSIMWRGTLNMALLAAATLRADEIVRVLVYQDTQANGATAAVTDILEAADAHSFNNLANKGRFRTLMDKRYAIRPSASAGDGATNDTAAAKTAVSFFKRCNIPLEFSGVANPAAITEMRSNNIGILLISESNAGSIALNSKVRLRFSDN